ncbi:outer membrane protein [Ancylobacter sp. TS-1]|uniref:outer membrane protein n=1 Tax=Ancylobacter sp. TS-1 TaxID=1850374 RepID=UPI001265BD5F|nr:outer membrane protein [Ancylobacter sp. TS-1]QFR32775.1 outer membrane beta-barrel protein [Ancylobacter sp. TS-1]
MKALAIAGTLLLSSGAAFAADMPPAPAPVLKAAAYAPAFSWTGLYLGGQIGYGWADAESSLSVPGNPDYATSSGSPNGFFGGGFVGYNYQFASNLVVGIEADINGGNLSSSDSASAFGIDVWNVTATHELEWFGSVRARVGYAFDRFLPFVTAGYAFGSTTTTYENNDLYGDRVSPSENVSGWTIGGGLEYAVTDNILARIEYRYTDYGDSSSYLPYYYSLTVDHAYTTNDVRVGLSYKF